MKRKTQLRQIVGIALGMLLIASSCSKSHDNGNNNNNGNPPNTNPKVQLSSNSTFGSILTDSAGRSLYFFTNDAGDTSTCYGACEMAWPVFYTSQLTLPSGLKSSDFATITRNDGTKQTTYKGWPLYYYAQDQKAGDVNGDKVGQIWYVAKPDYTLMIVTTQLVGNDGVSYTSTYDPGTGVSRYITDDHGHTLYTFKKDMANTNNFTKADYSNNSTFPIDTLSSISSVPSTISKSDLGTIQVAGRTQLTYKGWPLYFFGADAGKRGSNKGVAFPNATKPITWPVINESSAAAPAVTVVPPKVQVQLANNATFGNILTDSVGKTLYFFSNDAGTASTCTGGCAVAWPVFYASSLTGIPSGLSASDFATITRTDGTKQTTYKGWPLYYYAQDANAGDVNGDKVGNVWFVAKPDYTIMIANSQLVGGDGVSYLSSYDPGTGTTAYFTDDKGNTLYSFKNDKANTNNFGDNASWPIDQATLTNIPSVLSKSDFGTGSINGKTQLTYKGWPLYFYSGDNSTRGNTKGITVPNAVKPITWPVVTQSVTAAPAP